MTTIPLLELAGPGNNGQDSCPFFQQWRWQFFFSVLLFVFGYYGVYVNEFEFMSHSLPSALKTLNNSVHKVFVLLLFFCMSYAFFCFLQFSLLYSAILSSLLLHPTKMSFCTNKKKNPRHTNRRYNSFLCYLLVFEVYLFNEMLKQYYGSLHFLLSVRKKRM